MMKKHYLSLRPLILWQDSERPLSWPKVFGREALLEVEIGFGKGEFLIRLARSYPERNFVGIELEWSSVRRTLRKIGQNNVPNVRLLHADTRIAFDRLFWPRSLHRVYALFPMPWPKERHARHRIFSHAFLRVLNNRLQDNGEVQIITDYEPYWNWILNEVPGTGFKVESSLTPPLFATKYERKWREKGQEEFFALFLTKQEHQEIPLKEDIPLRTYSISRFDPEHFHPRNERGEIVVEFKDFLYDAQRQRGMVRVIVAEDTVTQNFWIEIAPGKDRWHIHVAPGSGALPTLGVQKALDLIYDAINLEHLPTNTHNE